MKKLFYIIVVSFLMITSCSKNNNTSESLKVIDGTYVGKSESYSVEKEMELKVTFKDNKIVSIETLNSGSTENVYKTVEEKLFPRIIESQSLAVDNITGATVSSMAAKAIIKKIINSNGGDESQWNKEIVKSQEVVKKEGYDVIVVGLGASGIASYISAAYEGATVFGIEKAAKLGGNGAMTAGAMAVNPKRQVELNGGDFVNPEDVIKDWIEYTEGDAKEEMIRQFVNESGETLEWLENNFDFKFGDKMFTFFNPNPWPLWTIYTDKEGIDKDSAYINSMEQAKKLNEKNEYMLELDAEEFILDDSGNITGVKAKYYDGTTYEITGKTVILAGGGYIGNPEMSKEYTGYVWKTHAMTQSDGTTIKMAQSVGGTMFNPDVAVEDHIAQVANIIRSDDVSADYKAILTSLLLDTSAVLIDSNGELFNEKAGNNLAFNGWMAGNMFYTIYNEDEINSIKINGMKTFNEPTFLKQGGTYTPNTPIENIEEILSIGEKYGNVVIANSIEELNEKLNIKVNLSDIHGKSEGKLYVIKGSAYIYSSTGGLDIDENYNVLKEDGSPIKNLYAVGNDSMGVLFASEKAYVTYGGAAQGFALTSGRLAGKNAALSTK